ncbi:response regulator transcription factor [Streptomyces sp. NPDC050315]|uniref:response regulator transcription factor n=1 Tax=Streptomyces sp. NPDC050315 TaxID=3155039 RepID=UPI00341F4460
MSGVGAAARGAHAGGTQMGGTQTRTEAHSSAAHTVPVRATPARGPIAHIPQQVNRCREHPVSGAAEAAHCGGEPGAGGPNGACGGREGAAGPAKGPALLVLGSAHRPGPLRRAFEADALGFVDKEGSPGQLAVGIRQVAAGRRFVDGSLGFGFLQAAEMPLTQRELSVLTLAAEGASVAEIAGTLHLSNGTVRNYMSAITRKTGARNRVDAIRISQGEGWL